MANLSLNKQITSMKIDEVMALANKWGSMTERELAEAAPDPRVALDKIHEITSVLDRCMTEGDVLAVNALAVAVTALVDLYQRAFYAQDQLQAEES